MPQVVWCLTKLWWNLVISNPCNNRFWCIVLTSYPSTCLWIKNKYNDAERLDNCIIYSRISRRMSFLQHVKEVEIKVAPWQQVFNSITYASQVDWSRRWRWPYRSVAQKSGLDNDNSPLPPPLPPLIISLNLRSKKGIPLNNISCVVPICRVEFDAWHTVNCNKDFYSGRVYSYYSGRDRRTLTKQTASDMNRDTWR